MAAPSAKAFFLVACLALPPVGRCLDIADFPRAAVDRSIERMGPSREQGSTQLCVANSAADAATAHAGIRVSVFSVAVRYFQRRRGADYALFSPAAAIASRFGEDSRYMIGLGASALETSVGASLCPDDQPVDGPRYRDEDLKALSTSYDRFRSYYGPTPPPDVFDEISRRLAVLAPSLDAADFIARLNRAEPLEEALGRWMDRHCSVNLNPALEVARQELDGANKDRIVEALELALAAGEPAVIHYDDALLMGRPPSPWESVIGFHASTIVAESSAGGKRHFLLRPNRGGYCQFDAFEDRCDRGHYWMTEEEVRRYVTSVAHYVK